MADKENPGLLHIQNVILSPNDELTRLLRILWSRQRKLTNVELIEAHESLDKLAAAVSCSNNLGKEYKFHPCATSLRIADVRNGTVPLIALQMLQCRPKIEILSLEFWSVGLNVDHRNDPSDRLLKTLMAPPSYLRPPHRLAIKELHLHAVDLRRDCHLLLTALDTTVLKVLKVVCSRKPNDLFTQMSRLPTHARPQLRCLEILHLQQPMGQTWVSNDDHTDRVTKSINDLLLSTKNTLSSLWIVMRGIQGHEKLLGPLVSGIENHGQSLVRLTVDIRTHLPPFVDEQCVGWFPRAGWERVCASMTKLELLCVPFPPVVANEYCTSRREHRDYLITSLRSQLIKKPRRDLELVGFGLFERNHFMAELHYGLRPVFFVKSHTVTMGRAERGMRPGQGEIWGSDFGYMLRNGVKEIDELAKIPRRTNEFEVHP
ncbi:MAG: hypothetical protein LQ343_005100 [Gyalolechia ehrenbergii]|nr:MAG: hypothetical protein LQ343_005100 [Gyalolechia ehrenbergii]